MIRKLGAGYHVDARVIGQIEALFKMLPESNYDPFVVRFLVNEVKTFYEKSPLSILCGTFCIKFPWKNLD